jgi:hypothetical protein
VDMRLGADFAHAGIAILQLAREPDIRLGLNRTSIIGASPTSGVADAQSCTLYSDALRHEPHINPTCPSTEFGFRPTNYH